MRTPLVLLSMAAIFAAMLDRAGFVDWPVIFGVSATIIVLVLGVLLLIASLVGILMAAVYVLIAFLDWATSPKRKGACLPPSL